MPPAEADVVDEVQGHEERAYCLPVCARHNVSTGHCKARGWVCYPQMGQPSIEMIKSSPTANHNRRNPYLFHIWSGRETSCACRLRLKLIPWNAAELQPSFFRNFSTFFCVCTLGAVLTAPPFSSCGWLFSLFSDATGCELPSDDPALAADALIGASMATRLVYEDLKQIGYWPSMQTSQGEG
eukprot:1218381-Rhodomonas_salina.2